MKSILVIGGGIVGAACALRLQAAGVQVTLIDSGDKRRGASYGNAGHIGSEQIAPWSAWGNVLRAPRSSFGAGGPLDFRWSDVALWTPWSMRFLRACGPAQFERGREALDNLLADSLPAWRRIAELAQAPEIVIPHGHATAWMTERGAESGLAACAAAKWGRTTSWREMTAAELARYSSVLNREPKAAVIFTGTGQVSEPQAARDAILASFTERGGESVAGSVVRVEEGARVLLADGAVRNADAVLVCAGPWSRVLMEQLGVTTPLIGERGYHLQSAETNWPRDLPTTVFDENFIAVSRFTSGLRCTSFVEFGSPDAPGDERKWRRLRRRIDELGIKFEANPDRWVGSRPSLPDFMPAIGRLEHAPKVLYAFGHAHLGLTEAPITAEIIAAIAAEKAPPVDIAPFRIERLS
ncbi:MAG: FAD-binding oxidoreductase [Hyphomonadaceae bacterium]|nr:FAD-binding oxidoreductase [Hyphomonadaceae bacterium]